MFALPPMPAGQGTRVIMAYDRKSRGREPAKTPGDVARRLATRNSRASRPMDGWRRETFRLPRTAAREKAQEWFARFPKAAYMTEIEFWQVLDDGDIEFTIRRLPTAD